MLGEAPSASFDPEPTARWLREHTSRNAMLTQHALVVFVLPRIVATARRSMEVLAVSGRDKSQVASATRLVAGAVRMRIPIGRQARIPVPWVTFGRLSEGPSVRLGARSGWSRRIGRLRRVRGSWSVGRPGHVGGLCHIGRPTGLICQDLGIENLGVRSRGARRASKDWQDEPDNDDELHC